jgi:hypothetical protein
MHTMKGSVHFAELMNCTNTQLVYKSRDLENRAFKLHQEEGEVLCWAFWGRCAPLIRDDVPRVSRASAEPAAGVGFDAVVRTARNWLTPFTVFLSH